MHRRTLLQGGIVLGSGVLAGCTDAFETESVWQSVPVVDDRPDAVYVPAGVEEMATYGMAHQGEYGIALQYTFPHRFYNVTPAGTERVDVQESDAMHLMVTVWDRETGTVLPATPQIDLSTDGRLATSLRPWAMISQRMGFHYGDNVALDEGTYIADIQVSSPAVDLVGDLEGRFRSGTTATIEFTYDVDDIYDLSFNEFDDDERGRRGAAQLMDGEHNEDSENGGHAPVSTVPPAEELPGAALETGHSGDAVVVARLVDEGSRFADEPFLLVSPRTPYNRVPLPELSMRATAYRDGKAAVSEEPLSPMLDPDVGFHYGLSSPSLVSVDSVEIAVTAPPGVLRHDGYETAFLDMEPVRLSRLD